MEETETGAAEDELAAEETENSDTEVAETEGTEAVEETEETETGTEAAETEVTETEAAETEKLEIVDEVRNATAAEDFSYEENEDGTITITDYTGSDTAVVIPETINGKSVTSIGDNAFYGCKGLTSIEIPSSITSIENQVFCYCSSLTSIDIPLSVTSIGDNAFYGCKGLTSIELPSSVTSIGKNVFGECVELASIVVDVENPVYNSGAGSNCIIETETNTLIMGCKNTTIPSSVTSIRDYAFCYCSSLTSIDIPSSVMSIGDGAFSGCSGLTSIELPSGVTSIRDYAFNGCSSLTSIDIPSSVTSIGDSAFSGCRGLTSIELPSSVTSIGDSVFFYCSSLTSIELPSSVTSIGDSAFSRCSGLTSIELPSGVTSIGDGAFSGCSSLTSIELPSGIMSIGDYAFFECSGLTSIEIPSNVTSIGDSAFDGCFHLTSIELPSSVTSIGDSAFSWCSNLTGIEIPSSVTSIGDDAFGKCDKLTIYCYEGSYAKQYAIDNDIPYSIIEEQTECTHSNTELRNAASATCTTAGYTGDTYCKDCGELTSKGKSTAALGHSYKATVTKQPTVDAEGVKTYTCSRCKASYTEKIAKLKVTYTVKFNGNGADSGSVANQKITYGNKTALSANKFQKKGYSFKGWNTKKDGSGTTYADKADGSKLTKTNRAAVTLYAQWTANKYTITFNGNGSTSGSMKKLSNLKYGKTYTLTKNSFKKKGYTFKGWNTKKDGSGKTYKNKAEIKNLSAKSGGKVTLYAKWSKTKYTITYNLNKGKNNKNNPSSYNITTKTIKLKNPTRKGYTFKGWYSDKKCTKKVTKIKKGSTGNITLYAKWAKKK